MFGRVIVEGGREVWGVELQAGQPGVYFVRFKGGRFVWNQESEGTWWRLERQVYRAGRLAEDVSFQPRAFNNIKALQIGLENLLAKEVK